ncbi:GMC family oxidoreductase [soil metagenome]
MIEDFRGADQPVVETDLCIIGGGAAGITLATALAGTGLQCCVLESGGLAFDSDIQSLAEVEPRGLTRVEACHLRFFGGSTNHWGGWCAPLNEADFSPRSWVRRSGWPITKQELVPYYERAQSVCGLGPLRYTPEGLAGSDRGYGAFASSRLVTRFYQFTTPPLRFGAAHGPKLREAANIRVLLNANVVHLEANEGASRVEAARVQSLDGHTGRVHARHYVLACGGIENARLLLLSDDRNPQGIGNESGLVGRCFMQHPHIACGSVATADRAQAARLFDRLETSSFTFQASIGPSIAQQQRQGILNCSATLDRTADPVTGYGALRHIWRDIRAGTWPDDFGEKLWSVISDLDSLPGGRSLRSLFMRAEQAPDPDSRVSLSDARDRLGLRKAVVDWRLSELDKRTLLVACKVIGAEFARSGFGRVQLAEWLTDAQGNWPDELWGGCHHLGTTRMSDSPRSGVVDRNCRSHSVRNLFAAGGSVFPTAGYANPTLTLVALALRLADHLETLHRSAT